MNNAFRPHELETVLTSNQQELKLTFRRDDGRAHTILLQRTDVPKVIAELVKWTRPQR